MALLTRDAILAADDLKRETVAVPEWGGDVLVRCMTGQERAAFDEAVYEITDDGKAKVRQGRFQGELCARTMCDESGDLLFTAEDVAGLAKKSAAALARVQQVALKLNGLAPESVEKN